MHTKSAQLFWKSALAICLMVAMPAVASAALLVKTGTYTGNGATSGTRAITGVGFQPKVVFVWTDSTSVWPGPFYIQDNYITDNGESLGFIGENGWVGTSGTSDRWTSIDSDGFTISAGSTAAEQYLNYNGATYYYLALGGSDIVTGSYAGNGSDNRSITGVGFQPIWVWLMGGNQHQQMKFNSSGASTDTFSYTYNEANSTNGIQALEADGFQVGTHTGANSGSYTYYYFAVNDVPNVYQSEYTGNATDNRDITGAGFEPDFVFIKSEAARNFGMRSQDHSGDLSKYYRSTGFAANYIQSFGADGFQVGSAADINTSSDILGFIAFGQPVAIATSTTPFVNRGGAVRNQGGVINNSQ